MFDICFAFFPENWTFCKLFRISMLLNTFSHARQPCATGWTHIHRAGQQNLFKHDHIIPHSVQAFSRWLGQCDKRGSEGSVPSKPKKTALSALFLDASQQKFWKSALANLDAISSTGETFAKQNFYFFFENVRYIFSRFKPFLGHSMDIQQWAVKKSSDAVRKFSACKCVVKRFWAYFHNLCVQKWSCLLLSSDAFWTFSPDEVYEQSFGRIFTICASKNAAVCCWVQTHFGSSLPARFTEKVLGAFSRFMCPKMKLFPERPKMKLFAVQFRRILEVLCLQGLQKKFWAHFHDLCVQKWSCFLQSSDEFRKFSPCEVYKKRFGRIIPIYVSKNGAVYCEVETHFGSFLRARFMKKVTGAFSRFLRPIMKLFVVDFRRILDVLLIQGLQKKFLLAFSRFLCRKMKLFAVEFMRILEVLCLQGLQKKFWAHFHDLCVQKWSCFLRTLDAFRKSSPCEVYKKVLGASSRRLRPKTKLFAMEVRRTLEVHCLQVLQKSVATSPVVLRWLCDSPRTGCAWRTTPYIYVARTDNNRVITACELYCCLLPQCEALRICRSGFPIATKGSERISTIYESKNEAVCREVQTQFLSSLPGSFAEKVLGVVITIFASNNETVCCEV